MAFAREHFFRLKMRMLLGFVTLFSVTATVLVIAHQARAVSNVVFNFTHDGHSPDTYGQTITNGVFEYVYDFTVESDEAPITSVEYEIDNTGRQDLSAYSISGPFNNTFAEINFALDQTAYGFGTHTITFYATTDQSEEASQTFSLEPVPDGSPPVLSFDTVTEGVITGTPTPFAFNISDEFISYVNFDVDGESFTVSPISDSYDYKAYDFDLGSNYHGAVDIFDGADHTFRVHVEDPYANSEIRTFTFNYASTETTPPVLTFNTFQENDVTLPLIYQGYADDVDSNMAFVKFQIDAGALTNPTIDNDTSTPNHTVFTWDFYYLSAGAHTINWVAEDVYGNQTSQEFAVTIPDSDVTAPTFNFTTAPSGWAKKPLTYVGTADDNTSMQSVEYSVDGGGRNAVTVDSGSSTVSSTAFSADLSYLSDGAHEITFYATDVNSNETTQTFNITLDSVAPTCTSGWSNLDLRHYSKIFDYPNIHCTDDHQIVDAQFNIYHVVIGTLQDYPDHHVLPHDGTSDSGDETYDMHVDLSSFGNIDGTLINQFKVTDQAGNESYDYDPIILEASDDTAPVLNLDQITPDPLTDTTPTITGTCRDNTELETNTFISNMQYKVDSDSYTDITLSDAGSYNDSYSESYSVDLPALSVGAHTVSVQCTDGASHTTTTTDTFTIQSPTDPAPGQFTYTESFNSTTNQDVPNSSNVVWGNGKLRLKEDISSTRTQISANDVCTRYAECRGSWQVWQDPVDAHKLWYYQGGKIYTLNTLTDESTWFDFSTEYGLGSMGSELRGFELGVYGGKEYLWFSDLYQLRMINLTDHTAIDAPYTGTGAIHFDFTRGRMAAYFIIDATGGYSNLAYLDLNNTFSDQGDDVLTRIPLSKLNSNNFLDLLIDPTSNAVYSGAYSNSLFKWDDHNNPADPDSFTVTEYSGYRFDSVFSGMTLDPEHRLIVGTANNANAHIYVIEDDGGTPFDSADDTITELANPQQLGYRSVFGIQYIAGQNGVGDQLMLNTDGDDPIYFNFNNTYSNRSDDTFIDLNARGGIRPGRTSSYMSDYNTIYSNVRNQGLYKLTLNRGWVNSGDAVSLPTRPPEQLVVDNFVAEANVGGPIAYLPTSNSFLSQMGRAIVPLAQAAETGIHYFVSTDGGVTWTEVTLGQLQQLQQTDYRVKFKISLTEVGGATPVLNSYSLAYAGYPDPVDQQTTVGVSVTPSTTTLTTATSMSLTVQAIDVLGYKTPSYNGPATLSLIDSNSNTVTTGLSVSNATITDGTVSLSGVTINKTGTFKVRASSGAYTADSSVITVTSGAVLNSPSLGFSASSFKIKKGEQVTLHWAATNLTSFIINPGDNHLTATTGDFYVHPTETTTYTITGDGPYGSASSSLTVTVEGELSPSPTPGVSPSPTATISASVKPSATPGLIGVGMIFGVSDDQTIVRGQKALVSWDVPDADEVTVDYPQPHVVSGKGSFEFFPTDTTVVTITAKRGDEVIQKKITIKVLSAPAQVQELARSLQDILPWSTPIVSRVIQATRSIPKIGIGIAATVEAGVVGLMVATVVSQFGFLAAFNLKTLLNILAVAGIIPSKQRKGFVHQAKNGAPIPFAAITVYEGLTQRGNPFVTLVSDMYGVYMEPFLPKGQYNMVAAHSMNEFPTKLQRPAHLSFKEFYKGEQLSVASNKEHPALLIPMDAKTGEASKHHWRYRLLLALNRFLHMMEWTFYPLALLSGLALWLTPSIFNVAIVLVYIIILIPKILLWFKRPVLQGRVVMDGDRRPVVNATLTLTTNDGGVVAISKSDAKGTFEFFAPKGKYILSVVSSSLLWSDVKAGTLYTVDASGTQDKPLTLSMQKIDNPFGGLNAASATSKATLPKDPFAAAKV